MKDELFEELKESIKEGGKILKGKKRPGREFDFDNPDPKKIRERLGLSQNKFAQSTRNKYINTSKLGTRKKKTGRSCKNITKCCS